MASAPDAVGPMEESWVSQLIAWALTAAGGFVLLARWVSRGGARRPGHSRFTPGLVFGHFILAALGLVVWILSLATGNRPLGWAALVLLVPVAALGFTMLARWLPTYRQARYPVTAGGAHAAAGQAGDSPPERSFPVPVVGAHGLLAVTTVVLVLLSDLGVGG